MRLRITVLACALCTLAAVALPSVAGAAPHHNRGLSIRAVPHSIDSGEAVLIYGRLAGPDHANQTIRLYHRINPNPVFTLIGVAKTDSQGLYEFPKAEGIVTTNRNWFVTGPNGTHSKTVHEQVAALVTLGASSQSGTTRHPITFSGAVSPNHTGEKVYLQSEVGSADRWTTLKRGVIGPHSTYQIAYAWRVPGERDVRVVFRGDVRNTAGVSNPTSVIIQQTEKADFTINTTDPIVSLGSPYTISGTLEKVGTTTPEPITSVSLFEATPGTSSYREVTTTSTDSNGNYTFPNLTSQRNELYQVRTTFAPVRGSAILFEGVQDAVTISPSSNTSTVGGHVTFSGNVSPDKTGHVIYLQKLGSDGSYHTVEVRYVGAGSDYQFGWTFGTSGIKQFRTLITGGPANVGAVSAQVTVDVRLPPVTSLPAS